MPDSCTWDKFLSDTRAFTEGGRPPPDMEARKDQKWQVVGGKTGGGILVREGKDLKSGEASARLAHGAIVSEIKLEGERLNFKLLEGEGPSHGWVSIASKGTPLLQKTRQQEVWIITYGTRGDMQPYIALCLGLKRAGYTVKILGGENYESFAQSYGIPYEPIYEDINKFVEQFFWLIDDEIVPGITEDEYERKMQSKEVRLIDELKELDANGVKVHDVCIPLATDAHKRDLMLRDPVDSLCAMQLGALEKLKACFEKKLPDLIIYNPVAVMHGVPLARHYGIPMILSSLQAIMQPYDQETKDWYRKNVYDNYVALEELSTKIVLGNTTFKDMGFERFWNEYVKGEKLIGFAEMWNTPKIVSTLDEKIRESVTNSVYTGFWQIDPTDQKSKSFGDDGTNEKVKKFIEAGDKPIYMGWGSCTGSSPAHMLKLALGALKISGKRALILQGWAKLDDALLEQAFSGQELKEHREYALKNVMFLGAISHDWLFPQCACLVHHGGSGTIAASWRSGVPCVICPIWCDQMGNADMVEGTMTGIQAPKLQICQPKELAEAITKVCTSEKVIQIAKFMQVNLKKENGIAAALKRVNKFMDEEVSTGSWKKRWDAGKTMLY